MLGRESAARRSPDTGYSDAETPMHYEVELKQVARQRLAVVRRQATLQQLSAVIPAACGAVWSTIRAQKAPGAGRNVAVYLDDVINLEVGVEWEGPPLGAGEVVESALPGGWVVTTAHLGPYQRLREAHEAIGDWASKHRCVLAGPKWEVYGHWKDEWNSDPARIRTDVFYLVKDGSGT